VISFETRRPRRDDGNDVCSWCESPKHRDRDCPYQEEPEPYGDY
jgi:hypothetical protein